MIEPAEIQDLSRGLYTKAKAVWCRFEPERPECFIQAGFDLPDPLQKAVAKRQTEFLAGRYCVKQLYQQSRLDLDLPVYRDHKSPLWPDGYIGSISHTRGIAAAVLGSKQDYLGLGLDLEPVIHPKTAERVQSMILRPEERQLLETSVDYLRDLTIVFSFKESLYKSLNPTLNRFIGFHEVQVISLHNGIVDWLPLGELKQDLVGLEGFRGRFLLQDQLVLTSFEWLNEAFVCSVLK